MNKLIFAALFCLAFALSAAAQSGVGGLKGFITGSIENGYAIRGAKVELCAIENNSKTDTMETVMTDQNGQYDFEVSFGYYLLTISAKGYQIYRTKVFIPSSVNLEWGTLLEKEPEKKPKNKFVIK